MRKLRTLLTVAGMVLILITGGFEKALAVEKDVDYQTDTLLGGQVVVRQPVEVEVTKNFIYVEPGPVKPEKVVGEFTSGWIGAALCGAIGGSIGYSIAYDKNKGDFLNKSGWYGAVAGYLIASNLGCALGVYLVGNTGEEKSSFDKTLGGSFMGSLLGGGLSYLLTTGTKDEESGAIIAILLTATAQASGATIGFNHSRRKKAESSSGALLNLNDGKLSLAFPQVDFSKDSFNSSNYKVNLFQGKF